MQFVIPPKTQHANPCGQCKLLYGMTCCESKPDAGASLPMTFGEASRIARYFRVPLEQVVTIRKDVSDEEVSSLRAHGTQVANLVVGSVGLYLPRRADGSCVYLDGVCSIPSVKPAICAMFPFLKVGNVWKLGILVQEAGFCFGQDASGSVDAALDLFDTTRNKLDKIHAQWLTDKKMHAAQMKKLKRKRK